MKKIMIGNDLATSCPDIRLQCIECDVQVENARADLWDLMDQKCEELTGSLKIGDIKDIPAIASSRKAYKACGKDPARYRLSAEALLRRIVSGKGLYHVSNVVDLLNVVSISTGFSIGGYDAESIEGDIVMGIGREDEPYEGLGRGGLNIEGMPVLRDDKGAFGTPTSDSERTGVRNYTTRFLMVIISYHGEDGLDEAGNMAISLLKEYATASNIETGRILVERFN